MAEIKISQLPEASSFQPDDVIVVNINGITKKMKVSNFLSGLMHSEQNLLDLEDKAQARQNLGVVDLATVQTYVQDELTQQRQEITLDQDYIQESIPDNIFRIMSGVRFTAESKSNTDQKIDFSEEGNQVCVIIINNMTFGSLAITQDQKIYLPVASQWDKREIVILRDLWATANITNKIFITQTDPANPSLYYFKVGNSLPSSPSWRGVATDGLSIETTSSPINSLTFDIQDFLFINRYVRLKSENGFWVIKRYN
jgi:acid stress-induced BolA-like protein IbaG/YrbA